MAALCAVPGKGTLDDHGAVLLQSEETVNSEEGSGSHIEPGHVATSKPWLRCMLVRLVGCPS